MRDVILLFAVISTACGSDAGVDVRRYQLAGVVVGRDGSSPRMVIAHGAIEGLMPAMSMGFEIRGNAVPLRAGDRIAATLVLSDSHTWLEDVKVMSRDDAAGIRPSPALRALPGAVVPDLPLVDQDGAPFTLRGGGRVRIVTFLYTRCPLPDFCPLMVQHLEAVRRRANDDGLGARLSLVGVTLDPAFDTPAALRAYGESMLTGSNRFEQWTLATGTAAQIEDVARFFGIGYRAEGGLVTHTLATAVLDAEGRVVRLFESNSWRPDDVYDLVRRTVGQTVR